MESFPGPHNYMRPPLPPPPSMADPHLHSHHQPPPPPPQGSSWYPPQFQYHPSHSPSPPPPPPPPQQHWGHLPPPPSDHIHPPPPYASHPNPPYPPHPYPSHQYPPPQRPQMPPPPPYSNSNQDWGNQNWVPHAGWEHHAHNNGEDWGAKARAWAAARNSVENQHPSVQPHYPSQYMPTSDSHYHGSEQTNVHSYQNFPAPAAPVDKQHMVHQPEPAAVSSVHAYYAPDGNVPYARKDGNFSDTGTSYPRHDAFMSQSAHKQEVPSSYSSIPGGQVSIEQQPHGSGSGESMLADQTQFSYGNQSVAVSVDPCDQPLQFTPKFNHDNNPMMLAGSPNPADPAKFMDSATAVPTLQPWTLPAPPNIPFPSVPPTFPSAAQMDPTISMPPHAGQLPPMLGRAPVPSFHSTVSSLSSSIGLGTGPAVHPTAAFPVDMYGTPVNSERPKKAAVPNWLRDEIIKKKDVIVSSGADHHQEESESIDDEPIDKSVGRSDQADSKSIDSSRSTEEEEEEDEDYEEAARTAAINQEIKRVLTEVLLKVTSDLFDDIATRVLSEDDNSIEAKNDTNAQTQKLFPPPVASASEVSEKVLNPSKSKEPKSEDVTEKSSSGAAGDVLGLVNYESDDDEEVGSSAVTKSSKSNEIMSSSNKEFAEVGSDTVETWNSPSDSVKLNKNLVNAGNSQSVASSRGIEHDHAFQFNDVDHRSDKNGVGPPLLTKPMERKTDAINDLGRVTDSFDDTRENSRKEAYEQEASAEILRKASKEDFQEKDTRRRDRHENRSSSARDSAKEAEIVEARENNKGEQSHGRHDERHQRKKNEDRSGSKERSKEQGVKYGEKTKEDSKKHSPHRRSKEITKEVERLKKASEKDDVHRKGERLKDEKGDRSKHKHASDRGRHKRRRSSSVDSRGRNSKDNSVASYSDNSTDEASEKSRRKVHSKRRNLSPSPVRSRRRQVSQSPPSRKASQRRHSPYSSLEASRGRRSRSRSPAHRRR